MTNRTKFTDRTRENFLAILRESCNVSEAARSINLSRRRLYEIRNEDPDFASEWDDAEQEAADKLEREAWRRAVEGTDKPVFYQGEECGYIREYSDTLMTLLLKAHKPEKFKDRQDINQNIEAKGGVLIVPGISKDLSEWEQQAIEQQAELKSRKDNGGDSK